MQTPGQPALAEPTVTGMRGQAMETTTQGRRVGADVLTDDEIDFMAARHQPLTDLRQRLLSATGC
jgi:hypothetical protein